MLGNANQFFRSSPPELFLLRKRCSENMQQIYRRIPMPKVDSIKLLCNFIDTKLGHGCSPVNLLLIFRAPFPESTSEGLLLFFVWLKIQHLLLSNVKKLVYVKSFKILLGGNRLLVENIRKFQLRTFLNDVFDLYLLILLYCIEIQY